MLLDCLEASISAKTKRPKGMVNFAPLLIINLVCFVSSSGFQPLLYQLKFSNFASILFCFQLARFTTDSLLVRPMGSKFNFKLSYFTNVIERFGSYSTLKLISLSTLRFSSSPQDN
jgi:hypothetical protein